MTVATADTPLVYLSASMERSIDRGNSTKNDSENRTAQRGAKPPLPIQLSAPAHRTSTPVPSPSRKSPERTRNETREHVAYTETR